MPSEIDPEDRLPDGGEPAPRTSGGRGVALVLPGGGARAAYQVGFLRALGRHRPHFRFPIILGVSAGAINAVSLAANRCDLLESAERLSTLWSALEVDDVFRVDSRSLVGNILRWGWRLISGGGALAPEVRGMVDTSPLRSLLTESLEADGDGRIPGIAANLEEGLLQSFGVLTSNYANGLSVIWVQGCDVQTWERPHRRSRKTYMGIDHVMASAALPFFFPAVEVEGAWHGDGGIRLTTPLAPAIHLGADRIVAISTRYRRSAEEAESPQVPGYPPPAQVAGQLLNAIFLDQLDEDCARVRRINRLLDDLGAEEHRGLRRVEVEVLRPSRDLGRLAAEFEPRLPKLFRYLTRSLGSRETSSPDFMSLVMFQPEYLSLLMEIGEADAEERMDRLLEIVDGS